MLVVGCTDKKYAYYCNRRLTYVCCIWVGNNVARYHVPSVVFMVRSMARFFKDESLTYSIRMKKILVITGVVIILAIQACNNHEETSGSSPAGKAREEHMGVGGDSSRGNHQFGNPPTK
jgi:hypothetical protein